jgi:hypothetical protein
MTILHNAYTALLAGLTTKTRNEIHWQDEYGNPITIEPLDVEIGTYIIKYTDGTKYWYLNGQYHRKNGPAIEYSDGTKYWYLNGRRHREDGPAVEYSDGTKYWYLDGKLHREDGPAIEYPNGAKYWYLNGQKLTKEEWIKASIDPKRKR